MSVNVKVISKIEPKASKYEREKDFKRLLANFRKHVTDSGIMALYKEKQTYESKGQKRRRKKKEADLARKKGEQQ